MVDCANGRQEESEEQAVGEQDEESCHPEAYGDEEDTEKEADRSQGSFEEKILAEARAEEDDKDPIRR
jgi:hypothetical protein